MDIISTLCCSQVPEHEQYDLVKHLVRVILVYQMACALDFDLLLPRRATGFHEFIVDTLREVRAIGARDDKCRQLDIARVLNLEFWNVAVP